MVEQCHLTALERLHQERPAQLIQTSVSFHTEGLLKGKTFGKTGIDLIGIHVLAEHDANAFDPVQRAHGPAHVVRHQEREIGSAPIGRQSKFDVDPVFRIHIGLRDEVEVGNGLIELRVRHTLQACPHFGLPVLDLPVSPLFVLFGLTGHVHHRGAWTASGK